MILSVLGAIVAVLVLLYGFCKTQPIKGWLSAYYVQMYANFVTNLAEELKKSKIVCKAKDHVFSSLQNNLQTIEGPLLEIGVGPGSNFKYYPEGTDLIALDPNDKFKEILINSSTTLI